jgi:hypothetical protein
MYRVFILAACSAALLIGASTAQAATKNGITPTAPKQGATVPVGTSPTFKGKVSGKGTVWIHVCKKAKKNREGIICHKEMIDQAKKKNGRFKLKAAFFDFPEFWLNSPGTYYWQAHRISCEGNVSDCRQEGPTVKFKVG